MCSHQSEDFLVLEGEPEAASLRVCLCQHCSTLRATTALTLNQGISFTLGERRDPESGSRIVTMEDIRLILNSQ